MRVVVRKNEQFAIELRVCRAVLNISQKDLADMAGLSVQSIKRLEKKGANTRVDTLESIRFVFYELGLKWRNTREYFQTILSDELMNSVREGTVSEHVSRVKNDILAAEDGEGTMKRQVQTWPGKWRSIDKEYDED